MPNPEVKPASAEGTAGATLWETRAPPAPGARCAGLGAGMREQGAWEGGPEGSPLSFAGAPRVFAKKKGRRPPRGRAAFSSFVMQALRLAPCAVEGAVPAVETLLAELCG